VDLQPWIDLVADDLTDGLDDLHCRLDHLRRRLLLRSCKERRGPR
jgi:hypothetical protein